jgi:hypothetical protein
MQLFLLLSNLISSFIFVISIEYDIDLYLWKFDKNNRITISYQNMEI